MADYREHHREIRATGTSLAAVSVDGPEISEGLRRDLRLPFPILCDLDRRTIRDWDVYNPRERGGIARPAVFVIGPDRRVRYATVDTVAARVPAPEIVRVLQSTAGEQALRRKLYLPRLGDWFSAIRAAFGIRGSRRWVF